MFKIHVPIDLREEVQRGSIPAEHSDYWCQEPAMDGMYNMSIRRESRRMAEHNKV